MSVLELTISYTRSVVEGEFDTPFLAFAQKKRVMTILFIALLVSVGFYLYMTGIVVTKNLEWQQLKMQLPVVITYAQSAERNALTEGHLFTSRYFIERGYEEPTNLGIITRARNVAETKTYYFY